MLLNSYGDRGFRQFTIEDTCFGVLELREPLLYSELAVIVAYRQQYLNVVLNLARYYSTREQSSAFLTADETFYAKIMMDSPFWKDRIHPEHRQAFRHYAPSIRRRLIDV